jgi:hypothetical protein
LFKAYFVSNGAQITSLKNVSVTFKEFDNKAPVISYSFPTNEQIIPT